MWPAWEVGGTCEQYMNLAACVRNGLIFNGRWCHLSSWKEVVTSTEQNTFFWVTYMWRKESKIKRPRKIEIINCCAGFMNIYYFPWGLSDSISGWRGGRFWIFKVSPRDTIFVQMKFLCSTDVCGFKIFNLHEVNSRERDSRSSWKILVRKRDPRSWKGFMRFKEILMLCGNPRGLMQNGSSLFKRVLLMEMDSIFENGSTSS